MLSQQELNDLRGVVTNLGVKLTSQAESYRLLMKKCKQLEESNKMLTQSNQELSQQMMSSIATSFWLNVTPQIKHVSLLVFSLINPLIII